MNETNFSDESILKLIKLPDLLSVLNALFGFTAILFVLRKANASAIENALVLILAAAVVDGLDGVVARKIGCSPIGKYLDSLADMVSFGVAPAIVTYVLLNDYLHVYAYTYITLAFCGAYVISGMLRLARFDAKPFFQKDKVYFEGFPITMAAISLASFMLVFIELPLKFYPYFFLLIALMGVLCGLMTSRIRYRNRRDKRIAIPAGIIFFTLFFFYAFSLPFVYPAAVIFVLTAFYVISPFFSLF